MMPIKKVLITTQQVFRAYSRKTGQQFKTNDIVYMTYLLSRQNQIKCRDLVKYFNKTHATIIYGEGRITDLLTYDKNLQQLYAAAKIKLDNIIINSNDDTDY